MVTADCMWVKTPGCQVSQTTPTQWSLLQLLATNTCAAVAVAAIVFSDYVMIIVVALLILTIILFYATAAII